MNRPTRLLIKIAVAVFALVAVLAITARAYSADGLVSSIRKKPDHNRN